MARVAKSTEPLYQTRGRPVAWSIRMTGPSGVVLDLTGAAATCVLHSPTRDQPLAVAIAAPDGIIRVTGPTSFTADLPLGAVNKVHLSLTDSQGAITDYVWPVIGEEP